MKGAVKTERQYNTKLRDEQAGLTRRRILDAARRLFVTRTYPQVTMQDVAREAGVAYQTVYSQFGTKLKLAVELCASELPHVGDSVEILTDARAAKDPEAWLRLMGTFCRRLYEPCAEVLRFMRESGDHDLLQRYDEIGRGRLTLLTDLGPQLESSGKLRADMSGLEAVALVWTMSAPESYERLVLDRGWTSERFESWLNMALADLILYDRARPKPSRRRSR